MRTRRLILALSLAALVAPAAARAVPGVAIFYYPWFGTAARDGTYRHWEQAGRRPPLDIASNFYPARGPYSSGNPRILTAQMTELAAAGVGEIVTSWWGWGSLEDQRLPALLRAANARGIAVAVHLEPYEGRTIQSVAADIDHLRTLGIRDFYVYRPFDIAPQAWATLNSTLTDVRVFAQTALVGLAAAGGFDGVYTYDVLLYGGRSFARLCSQAHRAGLLCAPSVGPGYIATRATGDRRVKARRRGRTYDSMWRAALRARPDLVTITSYNEWSEGTQIEPARLGRSVLGYLDYDGAYGLAGPDAEDAYLLRTACWAAAFAGPRYPFTTPIGASLATRRASRARWTTLTTCSTSL